MPELIKKSDIVLTKAGPASIMESLFLGKPLLIYDYMSGQESGNVAFVVENNLGTFIKKIKHLPDLVERINRVQFQNDFRKRLRSLNLSRGNEQIISDIQELCA